MPSRHSLRCSSGRCTTGPSLNEFSFARAAYYVDRLLKGAKAADLPVEQMSNIKLLVNLKTAKALGISLPPSIQLRADQVIR